MKKIFNETIKRITPENESRAIYYGMACEYIRGDYPYITTLKDIKKDVIISVDSMMHQGETFKVIYLKPMMKVIINNGKGKEFVGISICHEDDSFNPQTGYFIANTKAKIKRLQWELSEAIK